MNLLNLLKLEINEKGILNDKFAIARYIYIRTGQLFNYNPLYNYYPSMIREDFNGEIKDITNIKDDYVICYTWSRMYVDLLEEFNINAGVVEQNGHAKVIMNINNKKITADMTDNFDDIYFIKFGFPTKEYIGESADFEERLKATDKKIGYDIGISTNEVIEELKKEVMANKANDDERLKQAFIICQNYMLYHNVGSISGTKFIKYLLNYLTNNAFYNELKSFFFYDFAKNVRIDVININDYYYVYELVNGKYLFRESSLDEIKELSKCYMCSEIRSLKLALKK